MAGTVLDKTGPLSPGALVRVVNTETGEQFPDIRTNEAGRFVAPLLKPGIYTVEAEFEGFKKLVQSAVQLRVDEVINLRLTLEPGVVTEQVTVVAPATRLEETTQRVGPGIGEKTILPLGRSHEHGHAGQHRGRDPRKTGASERENLRRRFRLVLCAILRSIR